MNDVGEKRTEIESTDFDPEAKNRTSTADGRRDDGPTIVGIGASAGGLAALQRLLPTLPANEEVAYIIAQHLAPQHRTSLPKLLARHTAIPVETIIDGMPVRPNRIFVTPPGKAVALSGNRLRLRVAASHGPKPSIDAFLGSLAVEKGCRAVGIILSGTGSDGAHGIRAIKANEGITVAQTSTSAKFYGMPQAAVDTGFVDLVLPPEKMGQALESVLGYPRRIAASSSPAPPMDAIDTILQMLQERTGVDFSAYQPATIHRRIQRHMAILDLPDMADYLANLRDNPQALTVLKRDMAILATRFFRNPRAFDALVVHLRDLLAGKQPGDSIRIWVPGCSSGEEAYSIAILLSEMLGHSLNKYRIQLFATDIDETSIQLARKGVYPLAAELNSDMERFESAFVRCEHTITVKKHIREMVVVARQDLMKDAPFLHLDLISCRNVLTYVDNGMQHKLLSLFHYLLDPKGLLFIGQSESINARTDLFDAADPQWKIYRRREMPTRGLPLLMQDRHHAQLVRQNETSTPRDENRIWKAGELVDSLVELLDCCGVLTDEQANILYVRGDVSPYFKFPEGSIHERLNAVEMSRPPIRFVLQSMLHRFDRKGGAVTSSVIDLGDNGNRRDIRIKIGPVSGKETGDCRLIVFIPAEMPPQSAFADDSPETPDPQRTVQLEQALADTREQLKNTVAELETSTEELQLLNEELQTANEELQATNEELETSNEELQASNEELNTVNDELRAKSEEADKFLQDLKKSELRNRLLVDELEILVKKRTAALEKTVQALRDASEEQRRTEGKLRRLSKVFMDSSDPIIIEDLNTTILDANRAAEEAYGFTRAELIGQSIKKLIPRRRHAPAEELRRRCLAGETVRNWEGLRCDRAGNHYPALVTAFALKGNHEAPESIATIAKDISKIKSMQQEMERRANQLARLTNELTLAEQRERHRLAKVLHDHLQQLLAGAKLKIDMLRMEHSGSVRSDLQSALQMITESLKTSRSLSAELSPPVLYQHGLDKALEWLARWMRETHGLNVELNLDPAAAPEKEELRILLFESVRELLFNVVKHAETRSVRLEMMRRDKHSRIIVSDAGSGFDPQGMWTRDMGDEMGFGLFNIRERLQLIGGAFEIDSRPGNGTTVTLTAPLQKNVCAASLRPGIDPDAASASLAPSPSPRRQIEIQPGKIRVMLVDDHAVVRNGLSAMLAKHKRIEIAGEAADGEEAVALARRIRPDVILMDINMPKMNGVEATRVISAELPGTRIYALSMYDAQDQAAQMTEAGATGYLNKDGNMNDLLAVILQTVSHP